MRSQSGLTPTALCHRPSGVSWLEDHYEHTALPFATALIDDWGRLLRTEGTGGGTGGGAGGDPLPPERRAVCLSATSILSQSVSGLSQKGWLLCD